MKTYKFKNTENSADIILIIKAESKERAINIKNNNIINPQYYTLTVK